MTNARDQLIKELENKFYVPCYLGVESLLSIEGIADFIIKRENQIIDPFINLINKLDEIHNDSRYIAVWTNYHIHGCRYTGPTYIDELNKAKEVLSGIGNSHEQTP